jgi:hypothetical protein
MSYLGSLHGLNVNDTFDAGDVAARAAASRLKGIGVAGKTPSHP